MIRNSGKCLRHPPRGTTSAVLHSRSGVASLRLLVIGSWLLARTNRGLRKAPHLRNPDFIGGLPEWDEASESSETPRLKPHGRASIRPETAALRAMANSSFRNRQTTMPPSPGEGFVSLTARGNDSRVRGFAGRVSPLRSAGSHFPTSRNRRHVTYRSSGLGVRKYSPEERLETHALRFKNQKPGAERHA